MNKSREYDIVRMTGYLMKFIGFPQPIVNNRLMIFGSWLRAQFDLVLEGRSRGLLRWDTLKRRIFKMKAGCS
jgi:hypothetical protein